ATGGHPLLGRRQRTALRDVVIFESVLRATDLPFIDDHRVLGQAILPATGFLEIALAAGRQVLGGRCEVQDLALLEPLRWTGDEVRIVQVVLRPQGGAAALEVWSSVGDDAPWQRHAEGRLAAAQPLAVVEPRESVAARCPVRIEAAEHQAALAARGLVFGPSLHGVHHILRGDGEALGEIVVPPPAVSGRGAYECHPALLDACLQVLSAAMVGADGRDLAGGRAWLPLAIGTMQLARPPASPVWSHARLLPGSRSGLLKGDVTLYDADGLLGAVRGISLRAAAVASGGEAAPFYAVNWELLPAVEAAWMPAPAALDATAGQVLPALLREHGLDAYQQAFVALESLSAAWVAAAFDVLGWRPVAGEAVQRDALARELGVLPLYHRLVGRLLDVLAEEGYLAITADGWQVRTPWPRRETAALQAQAEALLQRHPDSAARLTLAARCGPHLADILRGTADPLDQLFPDGSTALAESLYRDAPEARAYNQLVREAVRQVLAARPADRRLRVLEVGGGTGGTTAWVTPEMPAEYTEYLFTDIGPSMVAKAREKFAGHGFMEFLTLDLEQPPEAQGLAGRRFDLILAANVVHATADLRQTLDRLRGLLAPGG
ncbi:MAG: polyketide synthase dehydratase domain-containing protein, partial [Rhodocyclaceae bacterium]